MDHSLTFKLLKPQGLIAEFVESFWMLHNHSEADKEIIVLPDGRVDLTFSISGEDAFHIVCSGLETRPQPAILKANTHIFAISFKLLAVEYILQTTISDIVDSATILPANFWHFSKTDLQSFEFFCQKATDVIRSRLPVGTDPRKQKLFELTDQSSGEIPVRKISETINWSERQINRYFNERFGLSLKTYCNILRFRASFEPIKEGNLFPELQFADQSHFIREIKKFSGVSPKQLRLNRHGRFIQFSVNALE